MPLPPAYARARATTLPGVLKPAYGTFAPAGVLPPAYGSDGTTILADDFLYSGITYTQSGNLTYFDSTGTLQTAAVDTMVKDYDPSTLTLRGYQFWEARTNLQTRSDVWSTGWSTANATIATGSTDTNSPYGTTTATNKITISADNGDAIAPGHTGLTNAAVYTAHIALKAGTITAVRFRATASGANADVNLSNGTVAISGAAALSATIKALPNSWYWVTLTYTQAGTTEQFVCRENGAGTTGTFYGSTIGLELGSFATPHIPTTASAVTRAAPSCAITGANFSSFYNQAQGTFVVRAIMALVASGNATTVRVDDTTDNERMFIRADGSGSLQWVGIDGGATQWSLSSGNTLTVNTAFASAVRYEANNIASYFNGANLLTDISATLPTETRMLLGSGPGGDYLNGWLSQLSYYSAALPNASLLSLST